MGVSKNRATPKWMVKIMDNPIKIHDLGVPLFLETLPYHTTHSSAKKNGAAVRLKTVSSRAAVRHRLARSMVDDESLSR